MKKLLPTSTAGSLPKPSWLAQPETLWSPWKLQDEGLLTLNDGGITRFSESFSGFFGVFVSCGCCAG